MPYRIDVQNPPDNAFDRLLECGALDVESFDNGLAAIIPDGMTPDTVANALGVSNIIVSPAVARDDGSVWLLTPRAVRIGSEARLSARPRRQSHPRSHQDRRQSVSRGSRAHREALRNPKLRLGYACGLPRRCL